MKTSHYVVNIIRIYRQMIISMHESCIKKIHTFKASLDTYSILKNYWELADLTLNFLIPPWWGRPFPQNRKFSQQTPCGIYCDKYTIYFRKCKFLSHLFLGSQIEEKCDYLKGERTFFDQNAIGFDCKAALSKGSA